MKSKRKERHEKKLQKQLEECTFKPTIFNKLKTPILEGDVFEMLHSRKKEIEELKEMGKLETTEDQVLQEHCTFQPNIKKKKTTYVQANPLNITGYNQHITQRRKVLKDKERRRKLHDKKIQ